jgi:hypothetical protein
MRKRFKQAAIVLVVVCAAAQLIRPERANPATDPNRTIQAHTATTPGLTAVLDRACAECHSNRTVWPWYTRVAPVSWLMAYGVRQGRNAVNFSDWAAYPARRQGELLEEACRDASQGTMPGSAWIFLHPEARLSVEDIETICAATRKPEQRIP